MTLADGIILVIVAGIVGLVLWNMLRKKDEGVCTKCSYAKTCNKDECLPQKKSDIVLKCTLCQGLSKKRP